MKKLVVISIITLVVLGLSIVESIFTYHTYNSIMQDATQLQILLKDKKENINNDEQVLDLVEKVKDEWDRYSIIAYACTNHAIVKSVNEKIVSLEGFVMADAVADAYVTACVIGDVAFDMRKENLPTLGNLL